MSNNIKHKTTIMPKITQCVRIKDKKSYTRKEDYYEYNNLEIIDKEKKPGSSIDRKKPIYIFPKIISSKAPPGTANSVSSSLPSSYKINNLKSRKSIINEIDKGEYIQNNNNINFNNNDFNGNININQSDQMKKNINNEIAKEKVLINNKTNVNMSNYKDISINFLINNNELSQMFEKIYKNDYNAKKKWVELNLFGREVFKIRLETYIKNKMDITSFIKNEIQKILSNQYYDYIFEESYKHIQTQCDEHMKFIENIYN